jgi:hypothetical protein
MQLSKNNELIGRRKAFLLSGGGERARTDDLLRAKQALSLSELHPQRNFGLAILDSGFQRTFIPKSKFQNPNSSWWA